MLPSGEQLEQDRVEHALPERVYQDRLEHYDTCEGSRNPLCEPQVEEVIAWHSYQSGYAQCHHQQGCVRITGVGVETPHPLADIPRRAPPGDHNRHGDDPTQFVRERHRSSFPRFVGTTLIFSYHVIRIIA